MLSLVLPAYGDRIGLSNSSIGMIAAGAGVGGVLSQLRIGTLVAKHTARAVVVWSLMLMLVCTVPMFAVENQWLLLALRVGSGVGAVGLLIGMQTRLARATTAATRGRAMSTWGMLNRAAILVGPLVAGFMIEGFGYPAAFITAGAAFGLAAIPVQRAAPLHGATDQQRLAQIPTLVAIRPHLQLLVTAGAANLCAIAGRFGRMLILPLIGLNLGMSEAEVGVLLSISAAADLLVSPLSGQLMDRYGRLYAIVPSMTGFAGGLILLGLATSAAQVTAAAIVIGGFNGLGSGIMLTLSADLAPAAAPSQFLSAVGAIRDGGKIVGPLLVGFLADAAGFDVAAYALAAIMMLGVAIVVVFLGETSTHAHADG